MKPSRRVIIRVCIEANGMQMETDYDYGSFAECSKWHMLQINYSEEGNSNGFEVLLNGS